MQISWLGAAFGLASLFFVSAASADNTTSASPSTPGQTPDATQPLDAATTNDLRCAIVYMQMTNSQDTKLNVPGLIGMMYWLGRLDGRAPNLDLENRIMAELPNMGADVIRAEGQRCGAEMQVRGKALTDMGADMQQRTQKMLQEQKKF